MRGRLRLWLHLATSATVACSSSDYLRSTLDKIQEERLGSLLMESSKAVNYSGNQGEIVFEADDNDLDSNHGDNYEFSYSNNVDRPSQELDRPSQDLQNPTHDLERPTHDLKRPTHNLEYPIHNQEYPNHNLEYPTHNQDYLNHNLEYPTENLQYPSHQVSVENTPLQLGGTQASDDGVQGYYYYFYPLNHYLQNSHGFTTTKDSNVMGMMMDSAMKNNLMMKPENKITPLFQAISWFLGTAMFFVVSILLMPKFRVKKAKGVLYAKDFESEWTQSIPGIIKSIFTLPESLKKKIH